MMALLEDRKLILLGLLLAMISALAALFFATFILSRFTDGQRQVTFSRANGVLQALSQELDGISRHLTEYSYWDATTRFVEGKESDLLLDNFTGTTLALRRLDLVMVFNNEKKFVGGLASRGDLQEPVSPGLTNLVTNTLAIFDLPELTSSKEGFLKTPDGILMIASRRVTDSEVVGPSVGTILFGRWLDQEELTKLSSLIGLKIELEAVTESFSYPAQDTMRTPMLDGATIVWRDRLKNNDEINALLFVRGLGGNLLQFDLGLPDGVSQTARSVSRVIFVYMLASTVALFGFVVLIGMELRKRRKELSVQVEIAKELRQAKKESDELAVKALAAEKAKGDFLAMMSHEIRTPLNAVIGFSRVAAQRAKEPEIQSLLKDIRAGGEQLFGMLSGMLDYEQICEGNIQLDPEKESIRYLVESECRLFNTAAERKGNRIVSEIADDVPAYVLVDGVRLRQVLGCLLSNAVKFTENGEIRVSAACFSEEGSAARLAFRVADTGIGIPTEARASIFDAFQQGDSSRARSYEGSGFGLTISKKLAELLGGDLRLEDSERGASFAFCLQLVAVEERPTDPGNVNKSERILIVDDNRTNARLLQIVLRKMQMDSTYVASGGEALKICREEDFSIVLMDLQMPGLDGLQTARRLREQEQRDGAARRIIIALTAAATEHDREKCLAVGMDDFLTKPYRIDQIRESLLKAMDKRRG